MSEGSAGALVCGFFDLAGGVGGLAWELGARGGLLLSGDEVRTAEPEISEEDGETGIVLTAGNEELRAKLAPRVSPVSPSGPSGAKPPGGPLEAALCSATVRAAKAGRSRQCSGHLTRWEGDPAAGGTLRHLAVEGPEGSLLLVVSVGKPDAPHGEEEAAGWLLDPEGGCSSFAESLLSTQFDEAGRLTRFGIELWREGDEQADRAAATRGAGTRLGGTEDDEAVSAALMGCSVGGNAGLASYLLRRG
jgi:hypothetical protein